RAGMIAGDMGATPTAASRQREPLRRDTSHRVIGGVSAGVGRHLGVDPLVVRIAFVAAAAAGGIGVVLYLLAWALMPADESDAAPARRLRQARGAVEVAAGMCLVILSL